MTVECDRIQALLEDGDIRPGNVPEDVMIHILGCEKCRAVHRRESDLSRWVRMGQDDHAATLEDRQLGKLQELVGFLPPERVLKKLSERPNSLRLVRPLLAMAGSILVVVSSMTVLGPTNSHRELRSVKLELGSKRIEALDVVRPRIMKVADFGVQHDRSSAAGLQSSVAKSMLKKLDSLPEFESRRRVESLSSIADYADFMNEASGKDTVSVRMRIDALMMLKGKALLKIDRGEISEGEYLAFLVGTAKRDPAADVRVVATGILRRVPHEDPRPLISFFRSIVRGDSSGKKITHGDGTDRILGLALEFFKTGARQSHIEVDPLKRIVFDPARRIHSRLDAIYILRAKEVPISGPMLFSTLVGFLDRVLRNDLAKGDPGTWMGKFADLVRSSPVVFDPEFPNRVEAVLRRIDWTSLVEREENLAPGLTNLLVALGGSDALPWIRDYVQFRDDRRKSALHALDFHKTFNRLVRDGFSPESWKDHLGFLCDYVFDPPPMIGQQPSVAKALRLFAKMAGHVCIAECGDACLKKCPESIRRSMMRDFVENAEAQPIEIQVRMQAFLMAYRGWIEGEYVPDPTLIVSALHRTSGNARMMVLNTLKSYRREDLLEVSGLNNALETLGIEGNRTEVSCCLRELASLLAKQRKDGVADHLGLEGVLDSVCQANAERDGVWLPLYVWRARCTLLDATLDTELRELMMNPVRRKALVETLKNGRGVKLGQFLKTNEDSEEGFVSGIHKDLDDKSLFFLQNHERSTENEYREAEVDAFNRAKSEAAEIAWRVLEQGSDRRTEEIAISVLLSCSAIPESVEILEAKNGLSDEGKRRVARIVFKMVGGESIIRKRWMKEFEQGRAVEEVFMFAKDQIKTS